ncbi:MAG: S8 family serine peptidase, partial [Oceanihabitans sp.]|nr:S8 family serine peptidase [Oceanihabitans sp.]
QVSWHFQKHNIPQAWNYSTGSGITIGLIDTGVSASQPLLNSSGINDGYSNGRFVQKYGTFIDSNWWWSSNYDGPHDKCGHGTAMASTMAAPRNDNGMPVGVAYNSNLVAYRATEDVLLNDYHERKGVSAALTALGNRSDVKIISMSIGYLWSIGNIKDAVKYANSKGKLIFAAGGTSTSFTNGYGVIFPATMSETVAVTGVDDGPNYERCEVCHSGSKIDFTIIMEGDNNISKAPPVLGFYNGDRRYTGGSSVATATTAGIAALVWAQHPTWSKTQVLNKLKQSAEFYPNKNSSFGYGNIDALQAVQ